MNRRAFIKGLAGATVALYAANTGIISPIQPYFPREECLMFGDYMALDDVTKDEAILELKKKMNKVLEYHKVTKADGMIETEFIYTPAQTNTNDPLAQKAYSGIKFYIPKAILPKEFVEKHS